VGLRYKKAERAILTHANGRYGYYENNVLRLTLEKCKRFFPAAEFVNSRLHYFVISLSCYHFVLIQSLFSRYPVVIQSLLGRDSIATQL
jgi:hypothetical protein